MHASSSQHVRHERLDVVSRTQATYEEPFGSVPLSLRPQLCQSRHCSAILSL